MPFFIHQDVQDNGLVYLRTNTNQIRLLSNYTFNNTFAQTTSSLLAFVAPTQPELIISSNGAERRFGFGDYLVNATGSTSGEFFLHVACVDTIQSKVLWVTECKDNKQVLAGTMTLIPSAVFVFKQPVAGL